MRLRHRSRPGEQKLAASIILIEAASNDVPRRVNALPFVHEQRSLISGDDRRGARAGRSGSIRVDEHAAFIAYPFAGRAMQTRTI